MLFCHMGRQNKVVTKVDGVCVKARKGLIFGGQHYGDSIPFLCLLKHAPA